MEAVKSNNGKVVAAGVIGFLTGLLITRLIIRSMRNKASGLSIQQLRQRLQELVNIDTVESYQEACIVRDVIAVKEKEVRNV